MNKACISSRCKISILTCFAAILEEHRTLKQPTLLLSSDNFITAAADFPSQMRASAPNLTTAHIAAGHWIQLEKPLEVNKKLDAFFKA